MAIYDGEHYMQDNASIHTAKISKRWFDQNGILLLTGWPPCSPDLNPIKHLWPRLKEIVYKLRPHIDLIMEPSKQQEALSEVMLEAWSKIRQEIVKAVLESMPRRIQAVIDADGWHTKY